MTTTTPVETQPTTTKPARVKRARQPANVTLLEQAIGLRDSLAIAVRQANELARSIKQQRRHERIVANTLASLKALQKVAG